MTRLEMSIHENAIHNYDTNKPRFRAQWARRVTLCMDQLAEEFLNHEEVVLRCYHKIPISKLLTSLGLARFNLLAIGKKECWIVNFSTPHERHFVGTNCGTSLFSRPTRLQLW